MPAEVNRETCDGCTECTNVCPTDAIKMEDGKAIVTPDDCIDCNACADQCHTQAIEMK